MRLSWWVWVIGATVGCQSWCGQLRHAEMTPEQVVEAYLDVSLNMTDVADLSALLQYTTGPLRAALEGASEETIKGVFIDRDYRVERYSVVERRDRTPRETEITFELVYRDLTDHTEYMSNLTDTTGRKIKGYDGPQEELEDNPQVTTENTVSVLREDGRWRIRDVLGAKTSIDFPLASGAVITPDGPTQDPGPPPPE